MLKILISLNFELRKPFLHIETYKLNYFIFIFLMMFSVYEGKIVNITMYTIKLVENLSMVKSKLIK